MQRIPISVIDIGDKAGPTRTKPEYGWAGLPEQREVLERLARSHSTAQQLALRARIIVQAADGIGVRASARELAVWPKTVRYWRRRWRNAADKQSVPERLSGRVPTPFRPDLPIVGWSLFKFALHFTERVPR